METKSWVESEFKNIDIGDVRLNRRLLLAVSKAADMGESEPDRYRDRGDLKGMYRFVKHPKVSEEAILSEHHDATAQRCGQHELVYLVQDTTEVNLTKPKSNVEGTGPLRNRNHRGFFYHPSLALSQHGVPLGVTQEVIWTRDPSSLKKPSEQRLRERKKACLEEKESCRWLEIMQGNEQLARSLPETQFVMLADSEADITRLFCESQDHPNNFFMIIRGCHNRCLVSARTVDGQVLESVSNADDALAQIDPLTTREVEVPFSPAHPIPTTKKRLQERTARSAELEIRCLQVVVSGGRLAEGGVLPDVAMNIVHALEKDPIEGEPPICWTLYTTLNVHNAQQALEVVDGYRKRWMVELFFKTLKSGMAIEKLKYKTLDRYLIAFAILTVVAWQVEYVKTAARIDGESPCEKYVTTSQWMAIEAFVKKTSDTKDFPMPTMNQYTIALAKLGGYINRKSQGPPGSKTIWRGMQRANLIVKAFDIFRK